jgi:hypothetical protein
MSKSNKIFKWIYEHVRLHVHSKEDFVRKDDGFSIEDIKNIDDYLKTKIDEIDEIGIKFKFKW